MLYGRSVNNGLVAQGSRSSILRDTVVTLLVTLCTQWHTSAAQLKNTEKINNVTDIFGVWEVQEIISEEGPSNVTMIDAVAVKGQRIVLNEFLATDLNSLLPLCNAPLYGSGRYSTHWFLNRFYRSRAYRLGLKTDSITVIFVNCGSGGEKDENDSLVEAEAHYIVIDPSTLISNFKGVFVELHRVDRTETLYGRSDTDHTAEEVFQRVRGRWQVVDSMGSFGADDGLRNEVLHSNSVVIDWNILLFGDLLGLEIIRMKQRDSIFDLTEFHTPESATKISMWAGERYAIDGVAITARRWEYANGPMVQFWERYVIYWLDDKHLLMGPWNGARFYVLKSIDQ